MDFLLHFGPSHYNDLFRCEHPFFAAEGKGDVAAFVEKYLESRKKSGKEGLICIPSGNHDMDRLARYLEGDNLKLAFFFLLTMPGAPFVYYGDEIGMRHVENLISVEGGYNRTGARSPMQWDDGVNAGFSTAAKELLYVPIDPDKDRPTVKAQMTETDSLYATVKRLIELRKRHSALSNRAEVEFIYAEKDTYPLAYLRYDENEKLLVIVNPADRDVTFPCNLPLGEPVCFYGESGGSVEVNVGSITLSGKMGVIIEVE